MTVSRAVTRYSHHVVAVRLHRAVPETEWLKYFILACSQVLYQSLRTKHVLQKEKLPHTSKGISHTTLKQQQHYKEKKWKEPSQINTPLRVSHIIHK